jgi:predicted permease
VRRGLTTFIVPLFKLIRNVDPNVCSLRLTVELSTVRHEGSNANVSPRLALAALPTGTGPLVLAYLYDRDATVTAGSILISTVASLATISLLLTVFTK